MTPDYNVLGLPALGQALVDARLHSEIVTALLSRSLRTRGTVLRAMRTARGLYQDEYDKHAVRVASVRNEFSWAERESDCRIKMTDATIELRKAEGQYEIFEALVEAIKVLERTASRGRGDLQAIVDVVRVERSLT